jgi:hypothetical protein
VAMKLKALGVKGPLLSAARQGYITEVRCAMPKCFLHEEMGGASYFPPRAKEWNDWEPTFDHYPITEREGGRRTANNGRLAHRLCNKLDDAIREGEPIDKQLARVAEELASFRKAREEGRRD